MTETPTPDVVALARRLYIDGATVRDICAQTGLTTGTAYGCFDGKYPDGAGVPPAPLPRRNAGVRVRHRQGSRAALVARMWRTAERQVEEIEIRLRAAGLDLAERESNARTLAVVARTLRELAAFDDSEDKRKGKRRTPDDDDSNDDAPPRDIEQLRRELAERLRKFAGRAANRISDGAEQPPH